MRIAEIIYARCRRLPAQAMREALTYVEYLERRYGVVPADGDESEIFLAAVCQLSGDFPDDVVDTDLGADAPRETLD